MAITPLPTNIQNGDPGDASVFNGWFATINSNFVEASGGGGDGGPYLNVQSDAFGAIGDGVADDTTAIQAALTAAAATAGTVWLPAGEYKITAQLTVPNGVSVLGPGAQLCVISTSSAISMMSIGATSVGAGDRYGTIQGFALDGNDAATVGFDLTAVCVQRSFIALEARDINGIGWRLDATQNCMFQACHVRGSDTGWAVLNDAATNTWINFEIDDSAVVGMIFDDDNTLDGYALAAMAHLGPGQNTFIGGLYERGTMVKGLDVVKGQNNKWISCYFTNNSSQSLQYQVHLQTNALDNRFIDCQFNGQSARISGYSAFSRAVKNEAFRNYLIRPRFEFAGMLAADYVVSTSNTLFVQHPQIGVAYRFQYDGAGDSRKGVCITPLPSQAVGDTASRPDFGPLTSPWQYWDTTLGHPVWWDGDSWEDPIGSAGGSGGATNLTRTLSATQVVVNSDTGTDATIPAADTTNAGVMTKAMFDKLNGISASADVTNGTNVDAAGAVMNTDTSTAAMGFVVDEDNMASDSATKVPTQQSVKAYVTTAVAGASASVSDGDKGDVTVASGVWTIDNNTITNAKMADSAVGVAELSATGTPSGTTFLRGDNTWATPAGGGSGISHVVDDATPQLGGNLDVNAHNVGAATPADLTKLHAVTADATELNILDGVTATAAELNALDGITSTVTELNYTDGVTSAIQTQLNAKAPLVSPSFTTPALGTPSSGTLTNCTGLPVSGIAASTATAVGVGSIELGHASDTTVARGAAGRITVEGVNVLTTSSTDSPTNKTFNSPTNSFTVREDLLALYDSSDTTKGFQLAVPAGQTTATVRVHTLPAVTSTLLYDGGALGTPASGTLTNCTGLTTAGVAAGSLTTVFGDYRLQRLRHPSSHLGCGEAVRGHDDSEPANRHHLYVGVDGSR
jgi:hypothetical protein